MEICKNVAGCKGQFLFFVFLRMYLVKELLIYLWKMNEVFLLKYWKNIKY